MGIVQQWSLRIVMGLLARVGGISMKAYFPQLSQGLYSLLNADLLVGAFVSSIVLAVGLFLISYRLINVEALKGKIARMQKLIEKARHTPPEKLGIKDPVKIIGIIIIVGFLVFSLIGFQGFPRTSDRILSSMGLSLDDLDRMQQQLNSIEGLNEPLPESCDNIIAILQVAGPDINTLPNSSDKAALSLLETGSGKTILVVKEAVYKEKDYFIGVTDDAAICHANRDTFCGCLSV